MSGMRTAGTGESRTRRREVESFQGDALLIRDGQKKMGWARLALGPTPYTTDPFLGLARLNRGALVRSFPEIFESRVIQAFASSHEIHIGNGRAMALAGLASDRECGP